MDLHSLPRRSLQFLCKRNKIPANLKSVAMADALSSLDSVEGLDELIQHQSPSPTYKPRNPVRSCRKTSPSVDIRTSALTKRRNSIAREEPTENLTALDYLLPCSEKASCLELMSDCTQTARENVLQEGKRSVGVQVDSEETEKKIGWNLKANCLDVDGRDEMFFQKKKENDLCDVCPIEVRDVGYVDALLSLQKVQDSSNSCEPIANSVDQISKVVNDVVEIVTDECIVPTSETDTKNCMDTSSSENVQVNTTSQEYGLQSTNIPIHEPEISIGGIDLDSKLNNVPHENLLGYNMDELNEEIEHKEEKHSQNFIQKDQDINVKDCNDTSSLQNVQEATPSQISSPKNIIFEPSSTVGIDSVNSLECDVDEKMPYSSILSERRKADDTEKINEETHFETTKISDAEASRCLDNVKEGHEASPSLTSEVNKLNMSMVCSVLAKNEDDGEGKCNNVQVTAPTQSPSTKGIFLESDSNYAIDSIYVKDCIDTSTLQNVQVNTTSPEPDLKSSIFSSYDQQTSIGDIDLNSDLKSEKNERGGSTSVPCKNVPADNMAAMNEDSEHNEETHSQNLIQKDLDIYVKDCTDTSYLQNVQVPTLLQIPCPKSINLGAPSIVAIDSVHGLEYDRDEKTRYSNFPSESRKADGMETVNEETHFETTKISDTEADGCLDNVEEVEEDNSLLTSEVHELNMSMFCCATEYDDIAKNGKDGEIKCNNVQVLTSSQRPNPKCFILEPDSNVGTDSIYAKDCIDTSTLKNDEVNTTSQEPDLRSTTLSLHGEQISLGGVDLNLDLNSDKKERGGSSCVPHKNVLSGNLVALNEESKHDGEEQGQYFIQKDQDIYVKECKGISRLQSVQLNTPPQIPSPKRIILEADSIVGVDSIQDMECHRDEKMFSGVDSIQDMECHRDEKMFSSSILSESSKVDGCLDNLKEVNESTSLSASKIHESKMSVVCSALKHDVLAKNVDESERKCNKESGEGMSIEIKKEPRCNKKRKHLGELSLRKLRLMYKENKEVIKLRMERETEKDADICCKEETSKKEKSSDICCNEETNKKKEFGDLFCEEETSKKEESSNICCKQETSKKEESGNICCKEDTTKKEEFGNISLRKLRFMLKSKAKKH